MLHYFQVMQGAGKRLNKAVCQRKFEMNLSL